MNVAEWVENSIVRYDLPLVTLDIRQILRGKWNFRLAIVAACIISGIAFALCFLASCPNHLVLEADAARGISLLLIGLLRAVVLYLVIPIYASKVFAGERQSGALSMIAMTPMSSASIILQRTGLATALGVAVMLISLPAALLGGARDGNIFPFPMGISPVIDSGWVSVIMYPVTALLFAATGVMCSCMFSTDSTATAATYLLLIFVLPIAMSAMAMLFATDGMQFSNVSSSVISPAYAMNVALTATLPVLFIWLSIRKFESLRRSA